ncbi:hypothetical protein CEXT_462321 [Caerostris extrusa]|uniref:Uncharacterized protein n=1 Tax=Caerostris extrusa TaxID=172846 RepID=A0AAV4RW60_CAEEX|nr:hypothetical protein CEXT_462321 [Caerostris extrusa]
MFERKILRAKFGPVQEGGRWRIRYNFELYWLYIQPQIIQVIYSNRLRWLGHVWSNWEELQALWTTTNHTKSYVITAWATTPHHTTSLCLELSCPYTVTGPCLEKGKNCTGSINNHKSYKSSVVID